VAVSTRATLSGDVKDALARDVPESPLARAQLRDALALYGAKRGIFRTSRPSIARLVRVLAGRTEIHKLPGKRLQRVPLYEIALPQAHRRKPSTREERRIEARAAFLAAGSLATPGHGYHLEFVLGDAALADRLALLLGQLGAPVKRTKRKSRELLYFKDLDRIVAFLTQIGAYSAVLRLEDVRAVKETKNRIRRLVNSEAANVDRAVRAGTAQRQAIAFVADAYGLRKLTPAVREVAQLRMQHPDESLTELGKRCHPPIGKAAVNGRLTAVVRLARRLGAK